MPDHTEDMGKVVSTNRVGSRSPSKPANGMRAVGLFCHASKNMQTQSLSWLGEYYLKFIKGIKDEQPNTETLQKSHTSKWTGKQGGENHRGGCQRQFLYQLGSPGLSSFRRKTPVPISESYPESCIDPWVYGFWNVCSTDTSCCSDHLRLPCDYGECPGNYLQWRLHSSPSCVFHFDLEISGKDKRRMWKAYLFPTETVYKVQN